MSGKTTAQDGPLTLKVRNVLGIKRADLTIHGIVLVGGVNGAGKSSLLEATACAALMTPHARGMSNNKAAAGVLHEGTAAGSVSLEYPGGWVRVIYPGCTVEQGGKPAFLGTALGIGSARYMALGSGARAKEISERYRTAPELRDLKGWFDARPDAKVSGDQLKVLWERLDASGWDAVHKEAAEYGTKLKGKWEQVSKRKFGTAIARTWMPVPLIEGEEYDLEAERAKLAELQADLDKKRSLVSVSDHERANLKVKASKVKACQDNLNTLVADAAQMGQQSERLIAEHAQHIDAADAHNSLRCPHCAKMVKYSSDPKNPRGKLEKLPAAPTHDEIAAGREIIAKNKAAREALAQQIQENIAQQEQGRRWLAIAQNAAAELAALDDGKKEAVTDEQVAGAQAEALNQDRIVAAIVALRDARAIHTEWLEHEHVLDALEPNGVRKVVLTRRMAEINTKLNEIASSAGFKDVELDDDLAATYGGRSYFLLSEGERWRVDLVLAVAFGEQEGAKLLLLDRLDVVDPDSRPGVIKMLRQRGIPTLMACTARNQDSLPNLTKARMGHLHWLDAGVLA